MKKRLKSLYLIIASVFISLAHLPFALAKTVSSKRMPEEMPAIAVDDSLSFTNSFQSVYDSLHLGMMGLSRKAYEYAQKGFEKLMSQHKISNTSIIAIADFSQPSSNNRLYIFDIKNYKLLFNTLVAHGRNSGKEIASVFSNKPSSLKSSPGFYITGDTYFGSNGYSLKLQGMEKGINDNALKRAIVLHGADYVDSSYIGEQGYIGRSLGCPAVPREQAEDIINTIKEGTCFFVYAPNSQYISHSALLQ